MSDLNLEEAKKLWVRGLDQWDKPMDDLKSFKIENGTPTPEGSMTLTEKIKAFFGL